MCRPGEFARTDVVTPGRGGYGDGMAGLGAPELIIVLVIVLVVFGGAKLPKLAKSLGEAQKEFKKGSEDGVVDDTGTVVNKDTSGSGPIS
jgi:sec-independent protein translocase protein TatA